MLPYLNISKVVEGAKSIGGGGAKSIGMGVILLAQILATSNGPVLINYCLFNQLVLTALYCIAGGPPRV